ncbi:hypothetical protein [Sebaldella sp. S0638]|uniref:hypothetical protein n=1 Tax=Sebaldella sp. S0638 TaxID=2957809 RepID=UPI00209EAC71|nr:hypothetical protein [Sebaldella sp. S0638]MCP1225749.1 hypothetical protein [Sebaldella sp. S0638]
MKKIVFAMLFFIGLLGFSETAKSGVYSNTKEYTNGGVYYIFTADGEKVVLYDGYVRPDGAPDAVPGDIMRLYLGISEGKNGTLVSTNSRMYAFSIGSESNDMTTFNVTKKDLKVSGDKKSYKFIRELTEDDRDRIYEILKNLGVE